MEYENQTQGLFATTGPWEALMLQRATQLIKSESPEEKRQGNELIQFGYLLEKRQPSLMQQILTGMVSSLVK